MNTNAKPLLRSTRSTDMGGRLSAGRVKRSEISSAVTPISRFPRKIGRMCADPIRLDDTDSDSPEADGRVLSAAELEFELGPVAPAEEEGGF